MHNIIGKNLKESDKSSHWKCSVKKVALKNFAIFTEKHCFGVSI